MTEQERESQRAQFALLLATLKEGEDAAIVIIAKKEADGKYGMNLYLDGPRELMKKMYVDTLKNSDEFSDLVSEALIEALDRT